METIGNIFITLFSGVWLFLSIPTCLFLLIFTIRKVRINNRKKLMKTWKTNDIIYIKYDYSERGSMYKFSKKVSIVDEPRGRLSKWNLKECLVELGDGNEYFIKTELIDNRTATSRIRESSMDDFMTENNGTKSKSQKRDDAINSLIKEEK